jgi:hypothetical protein
VNSKIKAKVRSWKPIRAKAQIDLAALLQEAFVFYVTQAGLVHTFRVDPSGRERQGKARAPYPLPDAVGTPVFSVRTEAEMTALRDLVCFPTDQGRYRLYWVRNTGLCSATGGPQFSDRHMEWVAAKLYNVWKRYVDPSRRRPSSQQQSVKESQS